MLFSEEDSGVVGSGARCAGANRKKNTSLANKKKDKDKQEKKIKVIEDMEQDYEAKYILREIKAYKHIEEKLEKQFNDNKMHHTIMLSGDYGIGKATFAYWMISKFIIAGHRKSLNDNKIDIAEAMHMDLLSKNIHPDVCFLSKKDKEDEIKMEQVRNFIERAFYKPTYANKFFIIDDINSVNTNGVNALLKILEEPPSDTYFFLINHRSTNLLDTIFSRCCQIKMNLSKSDCCAVLRGYKEGLSQDDARFYTDLADGSVGVALIFESIGIKDFIDNSRSLTMQEMINVLADLIEEKCKLLSRAIRMFLLEKVVIFLVSSNIKADVANGDNVMSSVLQNNSLLKQFVEKKRFEMPTIFY